jgi:hypothetical protein
MHKLSVNPIIQSKPPIFLITLFNDALNAEAGVGDTMINVYGAIDGIGSKETLGDNLPHFQLSTTNLK